MDRILMLAGECCGEHYPGEAGKSLVLACQLCPNSHTYWRISDGRREGSAA